MCDKGLKMGKEDWNIEEAWAFNLDLACWANFVMNIFQLLTFMLGSANSLLPQEKEEMEFSQPEWDRGDSVPGAFKLVHLQLSQFFPEISPNLNSHTGDGKCQFLYSTVLLVAWVSRNWADWACTWNEFQLTYLIWITADRQMRRDDHFSEDFKLGKSLIPMSTLSSRGGSSLRWFTSQL